MAGRREAKEIVLRKLYSMIKQLSWVGGFEFPLRERLWVVLALLAVGLPGLLLAAKTIEIAVAANLSKPSSPAALLKAIAVDPSNPEFHYRLGLVYCNSLESPRPKEGFEQLRQAIALSPRQPMYWSGLASACQTLGDVSCADQAIERTLALSPMAPHYRWEAANHYLLEGRVDAAMSEFRRLIALDPGDAPVAFRLCLSTVGDAQEVYEKLLAGQEDFALSLAYINFLTARGEGSAAFPIWKETLAAREPVSLSSAAPYVDWLIRYGQDHQALEAWQELEQKGAVERPPGDTPDNLVFNGGFEEDPLSAGLDWRIRNEPYTWAGLDASGAYQGEKCLRVDFTVGRNEEYEPVAQFIPVGPDQAYVLDAYVRSDSITSDSGPRLRILDPSCPSCLDVSTEGTVGTSGWHPVSLSFSTNSTTNWVRLSVWRPRSRSFPTDITGTFWLDDVTLRSASQGDGKTRAALPHSS